MADAYPNNTQRLLASYWTLAGNVMPLGPDTASPHDFRVRVEAAAQAGFVGIGLEAGDLEQCLKRYSYADLRTILIDNGLAYLELEALFDWFADDERRAVSDRRRKDLLAAAEALGAFQIKVGGDFHGGQWTLEHMVEEFGGLCRDAANAGTAVAVEIIGASSIGDIDTALAIVEGAGYDNGGILLDVWQVARAGIPYAEIKRIPAKYLRHVELCDAASQQIGSWLEDTINHRKLPGDGDLDVVCFLEAVQDIGYQGLYGVEILSEDHRLLPLIPAAQQAYASAATIMSKI